MAGQWKEQKDCMKREKWFTFFLLLFLHSIHTHVFRFLYWICLQTHELSNRELYFIFFTLIKKGFFQAQTCLSKKQRVGGFLPTTQWNSDIKRWSDCTMPDKKNGAQFLEGVTAAVLLKTEVRQWGGTDVVWCLLSTQLSCQSVFWEEILL